MQARKSCVRSEIKVDSFIISARLGLLSKLGALFDAIDLIIFFNSVF